MKKIIYLITSSEFGGAQKYVFDLATHLPISDFQAVVAAGGGDGGLFNQLANSPKIKAIKISNLKRLPNPFTALRCLKEITKLLFQEKPDILHINSTVAGCLGSWAAKIHKKKAKSDLKVIYTVHGWVFLEPGFLKSRIYLLAEKASAKWKDQFIVLSERDWQIGLRKKISPPEKIVKIYNGLDTQSLYFLPKEQAQKILPGSLCTKNKKLIGTVANLYATKGLTHLIKAAKILNQKNQNIGFIFIGDGPEKKNLEQLITKLNLSDCVFLAGRLERAHQYLKAFDIFVLPSVKEGMPFVILEAMAAEVPIIASKVGGIQEMIEDEKSGLLVKPKNPAALAKAIENLFDNPAKQKCLAEKARQRVLEFSLSKMLQQTYSLY